MAKFVERARKHPTAWALCCKAEARCRTEFWPVEKRRQEAFHKTSPQVSAYVASMPWDSVIKAAATAHEFWNT
eukprot:1029995-Amphidinium_carterae.1